MSRVDSLATRDSVRARFQWTKNNKIIIFSIAQARAYSSKERDANFTYELSSLQQAVGHKFTRSQSARGWHLAPIMYILCYYEDCGFSRASSFLVAFQFFSFSVFTSFLCLIFLLSFRSHHRHQHRFKRKLYQYIVSNSRTKNKRQKIHTHTQNKRG